MSGQLRLSGKQLRRLSDGKPLTVRRTGFFDYPRASTLAPVFNLTGNKVLDVFVMKTTHAYYRGVWRWTADLQRDPSGDRAP